MSTGGGGGPKFSFKNLTSAPEFVPSWLPKDPEPAVASKATVEEVTKKVEETKIKTSPKAPKKKPEPKPEPVPTATEEPEEVPDMTEVKENVNVLFMGHVDAGKSTIGGHILLLTGMVDKRTMEKYEQEAKELGRESWYLSWALDLNEEERNKGKTTEYGRGAFVTEKRRFTILDAPGHRNFIPSMIEGAAQADFGILVISARRGEFETGFERDGQTREHVLLAKTAGVKRIVCAINKMDDPTVQWSKERFDEIVNKMTPFLKGSGYGKGDIEFIPISGFTGANMKDKVDPTICPWAEGDPLLTRLDNMPLDRKYTGPFLMPIADKAKDMGTIAMGKLESGHIKKGQSVMIMPIKKITEVMNIFQDEEEVSVAHNGDNVRIRLKNVEEEECQAGYVLCGLKNPVNSVTKFEAQIQIVEYPSIICAGYNAMLHAHTCKEESVIGAMLHKIDKKTRRKSKKPPQFVKQGDVAIVRMEVTLPICLETFADYPQLGRFTLRDEGRTVAIGKVLKLIEN